MINIRLFKIISGAVLLLFIVYAALTGIIDFILYKNKAVIENEIAKSLSLDSVKIGQFYNFAVIDIGLKNIHVSDRLLGKIDIRKLVVYYNPFQLLFTGIPSSVYSISMDKVDIKSGISDIFKYKDQLKAIATNTNNMMNANKLHIRFSVKNFNSEFNIFGPVIGNVKIAELHFVFSDYKIKLNTYFNAEVQNSKINCFQFGSQLQMVLNLSNLTASGVLTVSNLNLSGIPLLYKEKINFSMSNNGPILFSGATVSNYYSPTDNKIKIRIEKDFSLHYTLYQEYYLLEDFFDNGNYHLSLSTDFESSNFVLNASILPKIRNNTDSFRFSMKQELGSLFMQSTLLSKKYGNIDLALNFSPKNNLPNGYVDLDQIIITDGFHLKANIHLFSQLNQTKLMIYHLGLNGGLIGNVYTYIHMLSNGTTILNDDERPDNMQIVMRGNANQHGYGFYGTLSGAPGSAIVSNVGVDFVGIGKCSITGHMSVTNDSLMQPVFNVYGEGHYNGKKYADTSLLIKGNVLEFTRLYYYNQKMLFTGKFVFESTNKTLLQINSTCMVNYNGKYNIPFVGPIKVYPYFGKAVVEYLIDNNLVLNVSADSNQVNIGLGSDNYSLNKYGVPGSLTFNFFTSIYGYRIGELDLTAKLRLWDKKYNLYFNSSNDKMGLAVKKFIFDMAGNDSLIGHGRLWQTENHLNADINFSRGGGISFSSSFDDINGLIDIRNLFIKNFIKENQDVFVSTRLNFYGPLMIPDFIGNFKIINSVNSEPFILDFPNIIKQSDDWAFKNAIFENKDHRIVMNSKLSTSENGFVITGVSDFSLFHIAKGKVNFNYYLQNNQQSLSYSINSFTLSGKQMNDITGGLIFKNNQYTFYRNKQDGLSGTLAYHPGKVDWSIDFLEKDIVANLNGSINNSIVNTEISLKAPLDILSFSDIFRDIKGEAKINLRVKGLTNAFVIDGNARLYQANIGFSSINTRIRDWNFVIPVEKNKLVFQNAPVPTTSGNFLVNGYIDISELTLPYFDLKVTTPDKSLPNVSFNINSSQIKIVGDLAIKDLSVSGNASALNIAGDAVAENHQIQINSINFAPPDNEKKEPSLMDVINWNLGIKLGNRIRFMNEVVDVTFRKDDILNILGSMGNNTFTLKGVLSVESGTLTYLGRDFTIQEGNIYFNGSPGNYLPNLNLTAVYHTKDEKSENVDVYLTFDGNVSKINLRDFYSIPDKSKSEISVLLGIKADVATNQLGTQTPLGTFGQNVLFNGVSMAENIYIINPLTSEIRRRLGLDMLSIRTGFVENWARRTMAGETNLNLVNMWEGSSVAVGKYLVPNVFVQYELLFSTNSYSTFNLIPLQTFGVELNLRPFDIGWKYLPVSDQGLNTRYEQKIELNINRRF